MDGSKLSVLPTFEVDDSWRLFLAEGLRFLARILARSSPVDLETVRCYEFVLHDMEPDQLQHAFAEAAKRCKFFPAPAELRELAGLRESSGDAIAILAWECVSKAVKTCGSYNSPLFEDGIIAAAVTTFGGWVRFCETPEDQFDIHTRREFIKTYTALAKTITRSPARLPGIHESTNKSNGYATENGVTAFRGDAIAHMRAIEAAYLPQRKPLVIEAAHTPSQIGMTPLQLAAQALEIEPC